MAFVANERERKSHWRLEAVNGQDTNDNLSGHAKGLKKDRIDLSASDASGGLARACR